MIDKRLIITEASTTSSTANMKAKVTQRVDNYGNRRLERVEFEIGDHRELALESKNELLHFFDLCTEVMDVVKDGKE